MSHNMNERPLSVMLASHSAQNSRRQYFPSASSRNELPGTERRVTKKRTGLMRESSHEAGYCGGYSRKRTPDELSAHRHNGLIGVHHLVAQLDQHLERDGRFFRRGHDLVELHGLAAHEAIDVVL